MVNRITELLSTLGVSHIDTSVPNISPPPSTIFEPTSSPSKMSNDGAVSSSSSCSTDWHPTEMTTADLTGGPLPELPMLRITLPRMMPEPTTYPKLGPNRHILLRALVQALYYSGLETGTDGDPVGFHILIRGSDLWTVKDHATAKKTYGIKLSPAATTIASTEQKEINWEALEVELFKVSLGDLSIYEQLSELRKLYLRSSLGGRSLTLQKLRSIRFYADDLAVFFDTVMAGEGARWMALQASEGAAL